MGHVPAALVLQSTPLSWACTVENPGVCLHLQPCKTVAKTNLPERLSVYLCGDFQMLALGWECQQAELQSGSTSRGTEQALQRQKAPQEV